MKKLLFITYVLISMNMYAQKTREIKNNEIKVLFLSSLDFKQAKATQITDFFAQRG